MSNTFAVTQLAQRATRQMSAGLFMGGLDSFSVSQARYCLDGMRGQVKNSFNA
jgi:hypothetical protein